MTVTSPYSVHFLVLGDYGNGHGWYAPKELAPGEGLSTASLALPVQQDGTLFHEYWAWAVTLDEGAPRLLDDPFRVVVENDEVKMETVSAWIHFTVSEMMPEPYKGGLKHPDFAFGFKAIHPVEDTAYELLFPRDKAVIIGIDPDEYR